MRRTRRIAPLFALALFLIGAKTAAEDGVSTSAGEEPGDPSAADKETARELYLRGNERFAAGDHAGALEAYAGADAIMAVPTTSYKLALALAAVGRLTEARDAALRAQRFPRAAGEPLAYARARQDAARLAHELRKRIPSLVVQVVGMAEGTQPLVAIDGVALHERVRRLPRRLDPGVHVVRVTAPGHRPNEQRVVLGEGQEAHLRVELEPQGTPPPRQEDAGFEVHPLAWVGFGFAVAGIAVGSVTGMLSLEAAAAAKEQCFADDTCPPTAKDELDRASLYAPISTASFIIGGAGLAVGIGALVWSSQNLRVSVAAAPGRLTVSAGF